MASNHKVIDRFESYLKSSIEKYKNEIQEIEKQLDLIRLYKRNKSNKPELNKDGTVDGKSNDSTKQEANDAQTQSEHSLTSTLDTTREPSKPPKPLPKEVFNLLNAKQFFICVNEEKSKLGLILQLFRVIKVVNSVVYCNSVDRVEKLTEDMVAEGLNAKNLIRKSGKQKFEIIKGLNVDDIRKEALIIVRRIDDLNSVSLYVNFDLPTRDSYLKKVGSRQKICNNYIVLNIVTKTELQKLLSYEKYFKTRISPMPLRAGLLSTEVEE